MKTGEAWLIIGPNGGGKAAFLSAIAGQLNIIPNAPESKTGSTQIPLYSSVFKDSVETVSLERAASLIEEERSLDESEYLEGGVDVGRTGRAFIYEALSGPVKKGEPLPEQAMRLETYPQIKLCGIEKILDRGLKYMSTGEIRRTLLAHSLISGKKLLILSDPFAGLDTDSRRILLDFFNTIAGKQLTDKKTDSTFPRILLGMERYCEIPEAITNVIEFTKNAVSFCGTRADYEQLLAKRSTEDAKTRGKEKAEFEDEIKNLHTETALIKETAAPAGETLIEMNHVNVGWDGHQVLTDLTWALHKNEHWLIRGPNGSGKTTFLELITGDNMQVFCNDVKMFGKRRGSGETIWEIKKQLGIVSYRLHVEYRMLGGTSLLNVIISGFHDSIGLYEQATDTETAAAEKWLALGGFAGREDETFGSLSYGEQRAILILRSAVKCPPVLILDEPCHGLDEQFRRRILDLLEVIAESGTTTLLHVTHETSEALQCEKHILELKPGETPMYRIITL